MSKRVVPYLSNLQQKKRRKYYRDANHRPKERKRLIQNIERICIQVLKSHLRRTVTPVGKLLHQPIYHLTKKSNRDKAPQKERAKLHRYEQKRCYYGD